MTPDVDRDIPDRATHDAHQLALRVRSDLAMKTARDAFRVGNRVVVLHERSRDAGGAEAGRVPGLGEKSAWVFEARWSQQQDIRNCQCLDLHSCSPSANSSNTLPSSVLPRSRACARNMSAEM